MTAYPSQIAPQRHPANLSVDRIGEHYWSWEGLGEETSSKMIFSSLVDDAIDELPLRQTTRLNKRLHIDGEVAKAPIHPIHVLGNIG